MANYNQMTQKEFDTILEEIAVEAGPGAILSIPGVWECVSEHWNNEVLDRWEQANPQKANADEIQIIKAEIARLQNTINKCAELDDDASLEEDKIDELKATLAELEG